MIGKSVIFWRLKMDEKTNKNKYVSFLKGTFRKYNLTFFLILISFIFGIFAYAGQASASYQAEGTAFYAYSNPGTDDIGSSYVYENIAFYAYQDNSVAETLPVYQFYNTANGDHFYTISETEKDYVINNLSSVYQYAGIKFYIYSTQQPNTLPVYRFYNIQNGDHFYTISETERSYVINNLSAYYKPEGVAFYAYANQQTNSLPVYRFYNGKTGDHYYTISDRNPVYRFYNIQNDDHFYTISEIERSYIVSKLSAVYKYEGTAFYAFNSQITDSMPVYRFYNIQNGDHFYTISETERSYVINNLSAYYKPEGVAFYAYANQQTNSLPVYRFYNGKTGDHFYTISEAEKNYLETPLLGPDIAVGLWNYTKADIQGSPFKIKANKPYNIKNKDGSLIAPIPAGTTTKVTYDSNGNLKIYNSIADTLSKTEVMFDAADGDNTNIIFDVSRPSSSYDNYRGKIKIRYTDSNNIWVINILPLEHYVWGDGETTGTGHINHTRVMASIFRTYGYWYIKYATVNAPYGFKIKSDSGNQIYTGYDWETTHPNIKKAAEETRGMLATYGNDVALTPYSSWSDGRTRSFQERWGSHEYPWCKSVSDPYGKHPTMTTAQLEAAGNHMVGLVGNGSVNLAANYGWDWQRIMKYYYTGISLNTNY